jgi:acylphosphatase
MVRMTQELTGRSFHVVGVVQGVGFRWFARETAARAGTTGWVENRPDGSVHGEVFGTVEAVTLFLTEVARGPTLGRVDKVDVTMIAHQQHTGFIIRK